MNKFILIITLAIGLVSCSKTECAQPVTQPIELSAQTPKDWTLYYIKEEVQEGLWAVTAISYDKDWLNYGGILLTNEPFGMSDYQCWQQVGGTGDWNPERCGWWMDPDPIVDPNAMPAEPKD